MPGSKIADEELRSPVVVQDRVYQRLVAGLALPFDDAGVAHVHDDGGYGSPRCWNQRSFK
jgi:hypothetical protein